MLSLWYVAAGYVVLVWWASTGLVLYLDGLPGSSYGPTFGAAAAVFAVAAVGVWGTRDGPGVLAAYCAFTCAVALWAFIEVSYLTNRITGPEKRPCPPDCRGLQRFGRALLTSLYHELLIVAVGVVLLFTLAGSVNKTALYTFLVLWLMRWSAKLNIFFGVRNLNEDWLPGHLKFLLSYMRQQPWNWFFPFSIVAASAVAVFICSTALQADAPGRAVAGALVVTLLTLAILEHWLLVLPIDATRLWAWGMSSRQDANES